MKNFLFIFLVLMENYKLLYRKYGKQNKEVRESIAGEKM